MSFPDFETETHMNDEIQVEHIESHQNVEDDFNFNINVNQATNENFFGEQNVGISVQNVPTEFGNFEVVNKH